MYLDLNIDLEHITYHPLVYIAACLVLIVIAKFTLGLFSKNINIDHELVEKDNFAFSIAHVGYYIGLLISIVGVLSGSGSSDFVEDIGLTLAYGGISILLLNLSAIMNNKVIFSKYNIREEIIERQNVGLGVIEGANFIATGFIVYGSMKMDLDEPWLTLIYWGIAQIFFFLISQLYDIITPYKIRAEIEKGNSAVAVGYAGALIAFGILLAHGIGVSHTSVVESLIYIGIDVAAGVVLIPILRVITDKILLPKRKLTDELVNQEKPNVGVAFIEAFSYIAGAILFTYCW
jgi:uncharacterized membrane protein YjfL (UPF0719 family)